MADAMWAAWLPSIDNVTNRIQDPDDFGVGPGSRLAADDDASDPYQVSHCARACLNAGVDHLHAAKALMFGAVPILHANSEYSLFRGALENLATAFWVLHPAQRSMRVERELRWMVKNFKDQDKALGGLGLPNYIPGEVNVEHLVDIADRAVRHVHGAQGLLQHVSAGVRRGAFERSKCASDVASVFRIRTWPAVGESGHERYGCSVDLRDHENSPLYQRLQASTGCSVARLPIDERRRRIIHQAGPRSHRHWGHVAGHAGRAGRGALRRAGLVLDVDVHLVGRPGISLPGRPRGSS